MYRDSLESSIARCHYIPFASSIEMNLYETFDLDVTKIIFSKLIIGLKNGCIRSLTMRLANISPVVFANLIAQLTSDQLKNLNKIIIDVTDAEIDEDFPEKNEIDWSCLQKCQSLQTLELHDWCHVKSLKSILLIIFPTT